MLAIFYFILVLPMKKKQQKVQAFLQALKEGDRVVTSGGMYRHDYEAEGRRRPAADRAERQGRRLAGRRSSAIRDNRPSSRTHEQEPPLESPSVLAVLILFTVVGVYPILASMYHLPAPQAIMNKQLKLGLDLKGGVHLVLRVKTDTALRVETELEMQRVAEAAQNGGHLRRRRRPRPPRSSSASRACRRRRTRRSGRPLASTSVETNFDRAPGASGTYTFTMKPNIERQLREESVVQAQQTIERRINELGVAEPSIARQGRTAIRSWSSCRASTM